MQARRSRVARVQAGLRVLGVPVGLPSYILSQLEQKAGEHEEFLRRIPVIQDVQAAWLLLLCCAVPRALFWLRTVQPELTASLQNVTTRTCGRLCNILLNGVGSNVVSSALKLVVSRSMCTLRRSTAELLQISHLPDALAQDLPVIFPDEAPGACTTQFDVAPLR